MPSTLLAASADHTKPFEEQQALHLVIKLCMALEVEKIDYCHWKSNEAIARSASGENDLDLLVGRADAERFTAILFRLGFRQAQETPDKSLPGVLNYYGYDADSDRIIHVHVHYQLVLGNDLSKNYRIPIEQAYLDSAAQHGLFRLPAPEFELLIFVLRMVLKHSTWDSLLMLHGALSPSERRELKDLATTENLQKAQILLKEHLPYVDQALFAACLQVIEPGCDLTKRVQTGETLQKALAACARSPHAQDILLKFMRRLSLAVKSRLFHRKTKRRLANGGLLVAIVGGDGSGKSTVIDGLDHWLPRIFGVTKFHMGKPSWSWTTIAIRALLKIGTTLGLYAFREDVNNDGMKFPGYASLIRTVCNGRDRYLTYVKARRIASNGGLVICDRYPLPNLLAMDAPQCERVMKQFNRTNKFLTWLTQVENGYYRKIAMPDVLIVLRVDPNIAVQRKVEESEVSVRKRSSLVWELDWNLTSAHVLDASQPKEKILSQVKDFIWGYL